MYRRRPPPVRYVTTQKKFLKKSAGARTIIKFAGDLKSLKSYVVNFICDRSIICVPIFTMQTSVVVAQWLKSRPVCLLYMIVFIALIFI